MGRPTLAEGLALAVLAVLVALPLGIGPYPVRVATVIFMWAALAGAWNLLAGYAGSTDLGPVVHYGVGAFATAAFMLKAQLPFLVAVVLGGVAIWNFMPAVFVAPGLILLWWCYLLERFFVARGYVQLEPKEAEV